MLQFAIFDHANNRLQFITNATTFEEAIKLFDAAVGIDPYGEGLSAVSARYFAYVVTDDEAEALDTWGVGGRSDRSLPPLSCLMRFAL